MHNFSDVNMDYFFYVKYINLRTSFYMIKFRFASNAFPVIEHVLMGMFKENKYC